jgi:hypothetical protein
MSPGCPGADERQSAATGGKLGIVIGDPITFTKDAQAPWSNHFSGLLKIAAKEPMRWR